jgi:hypothetical protein
MKFYILIVFCLVAGDASAKDFTRNALSGKPARMATYRSWTLDCQSKLGVVKVISKPSHGVIIPSEVQSTINASRVRPELTAHCVGKPTNGFRVDYTSERGFKGADYFVLQFTYGRQVDIDHFTVNVQ